MKGHVVRSRPERLLMISLMYWTVLTASTSASAQAPDGLFHGVRDQAIISTQIRLALPSAQRGYRLLASTVDPSDTKIAATALRDSYRYLRAAQEGGEMVLSRSSFPDPLTALRNQRIWQVRLQLLKCIDNTEHLSDASSPYRSACLDGLPQALRTLQVIEGTLP